MSVQNLQIGSKTAKNDHKRQNISWKNAQQNVKLKESE